MTSVVKNINKDIKQLKRDILTRFNVNDPTCGVKSLDARQARATIRILLVKINDYLNSPKCDAISCLSLIKDADYLIRLYQIVGGKIKPQSCPHHLHHAPHKNIHKILHLLFISSKKMSKKQDEIRKAAKRLREKLSNYCDPDNTIKQKTPPQDIHVAHDRAGSIGYKLIGKKKGGIHSSGEHGGVYEYKENDQQEFGHKMLVKRETYKDKPQYGKIIAEFVGGAIIQELAKDQAAKIVLVDIDNHDPSSDNVYIGSQFFNDYTDLYKFAYWLHNKPEPKDRPKFVGTLNYGPIQETVSRCVKKSDFATITSAMLVASMFDMHAANIGFDGGKLVCLDFASSLYHLHKKIHANSHLRFLPGFGPTNHFREYPRTMRITPSMADALEKAAEINYDSTIDKAIDKVSSNFLEEVEPIKQFAIHLGFNPTLSTNSASGLASAIKAELKKRMSARSSALAELALQIRIDLAIKKQKNGGYRIDPDQLAKLVKANQKYFRDRLKDGRYHFRQKEHKSCLLARLFGLRITENYFAKKINEGIKKLDLDKKTHQIVFEPKPEKGCFSNLRSHVRFLNNIGFFRKQRVVLKTALDGLPDMIDNVLPEPLPTINRDFQSCCPIIDFLKHKI